MYYVMQVVKAGYAFQPGDRSLAGKAEDAL
jgi:hypothetical protein